LASLAEREAAQIMIHGPVIGNMNLRRKFASLIRAVARGGRRLRPQEDDSGERCGKKGCSRLRGCK